MAYGQNASSWDALTLTWFRPTVLYLFITDAVAQRLPNSQVSQGFAFNLKKKNKSDSSSVSHSFSVGGDTLSKLPAGNVCIFMK